MSATAETVTTSTSKREAEGKGKAKDAKANNRRAKSGTSEKQKAANQRNSAKSTGPRTPVGKLNSKYNAYKHGMTARSVLLPGEKAEDLAAHQQHFIDSFQPRHAVELAIVERMALDIWRADRAERGAGVRIAERLRHEPLEKAEKEQEEAIELGGRLFWQPAFPLPISRRSAVGKITEPQCAESPVHPHHPARLRLRLEQTLFGCDWLIARWHELSQRLYFNKLWLTADNFFMVRLLGKHAIDMVDNLDVVRVFLCGLTLLSAPKSGPEREAFDWKGALIKMLVTFDLENKRGIADSAAKQCEPFARRLAELPLAKLAPRDENHARSWLTGIIDQELRRLHDIRLYLQVVAQADEAEAPARLAFESGPEGDRQRRYGLSAERLVIKRFGDFLKTRSQIIAGTFDPTEVELQDLLGSAPPPVGGGLDSTVVIPHVAQTEPSERGETLTRSVSEEVGCGTSLTHRVSVGTECGEYGDPLSCASGQCDAVDDSQSPCGIPPAPGERDLPVLSQELVDGCDGDQFLRNEAISPFVSGPLSMVRDEPVATEEAWVRGSVVPVGSPSAVETAVVPGDVAATDAGHGVLDSSRESKSCCDDAQFLRNEAISAVVSGSSSGVGCDLARSKEAASPVPPGNIQETGPSVAVADCGIGWERGAERGGLDTQTVGSESMSEALAAALAKLSEMRAGFAPSRPGRAGRRGPPVSTTEPGSVAWAPLAEKDSSLKVEIIQARE